MSRSYLIDFENVHEYGLKNIRFGRDDMIYLFYTAHAAKIELDALSEIKAAVKFIKVNAGKQSLDMHLVSYLGHILRDDSKEYIIVSNDTDFDGVLQFWQNRGYSVTRQDIDLGNKAPLALPVKDQPFKNQQQKELPTKDLQQKDQTIPESTQINNKIMSIYSKANVDHKIAGAIASLVVKNLGDPNRKSVIYRNIVKQYGQKKGLEYYTYIKKEL